MPSPPQKNFKNHYICRKKITNPRQTKTNQTKTNQPLAKPTNQQTNQNQPTLANQPTNQQTKPNSTFSKTNPSPETNFMVISSCLSGASLGHTPMTGFTMVIGVCIDLGTRSETNKWRVDVILLMDILHHLECKEPYKYWDKLPTVSTG